MTTFDTDPTWRPEYGGEAQPVVWFLKEGTGRGTGLNGLSIPCLTKDIAMVYADKRAGGLLEIGRRQGIDQAWQDYGNLPRGRDYVRQVCGPWMAQEAVWQHVTAEFVVIDPATH